MIGHYRGSDKGWVGVGGGDGNDRGDDGRPNILVGREDGG